jgi:hypothetical protein
MGSYPTKISTFKKDHYGQYDLLSNETVCDANYPNKIYKKELLKLSSVFNFYDFDTSEVIDIHKNTARHLQIVKFYKNTKFGKIVIQIPSIPVFSIKKFKELFNYQTSIFYKTYLTPKMYYIDNDNAHYDEFDIMSFINDFNSELDKRNLILDSNRANKFYMKKLHYINVCLDGTNTINFFSLTDVFYIPGNISIKILFMNIIKKYIQKTIECENTISSTIENSKDDKYMKKLDTYHQSSIKTTTKTDVSNKTVCVDTTYTGIKIQNLRQLKLADGSFVVSKKFHRLQDFDFDYEKLGFTKKLKIISTLGEKKIGRVIFEKETITGTLRIAVPYISNFSNNIKTSLGMNKYIKIIHIPKKEFCDRLQKQTQKINYDILHNYWTMMQYNNKREQYKIYNIGKNLGILKERQPLLFCLDSKNKINIFSDYDLFDMNKPEFKISQIDKLLIGAYYLIEYNEGLFIQKL